ncbi:hypothetical protein NDU88_009027 [Pleurodeles waltl]|uniref:Uncharacterized protein n=1 Tax=Pleurodeles waltl TaxID=8319 RepID=A0AAV7NXR9_PLEWA|nr:hypothetical protein NDU88_009027 [Pleurodeles waltl]
MQNRHPHRPSSKGATCRVRAAGQARGEVQLDQGRRAYSSMGRVPGRANSEPSSEYITRAIDCDHHDVAGFTEHMVAARGGVSSHEQSFQAYGGKRRADWYQPGSKGKQYSGSRQA